MNTTFEQVVEAIRQFSPEQREALTDLLRRWEIQAFRRETAEAAKSSLAQFREGHFMPQLAKAAARELGACLDDWERDGN